MIACYADFPQGALPVVGAKDAKQAQENLGALGWKLSSGEVVALEDAAQPVIHQPGRAVVALEPMAADPAERQGRIAAPIEEQECLFAARQGLPDLGLEDG